MNGIPSLRARAQEGLRGQYDLLGNALTLGGTTAATAVLGVVFWWVAARFLTTTSVGYGSAALSAMALLANVGMLGYGSLLIGRVAGAGSDRNGLIASGLLAAGVTSAVLGLAFGIVAGQLSPGFAPYVATLARALLFALGVGLTSTSIVLDDALVGLFLGSVQLTRNIIFGVTKLGVLTIMAALVPDSSGLDIIASWVAGTILSLLAIAFVLARRGKRIFHAPRVKVLRRSARTALMHHWINLAAVGPRMLVPLIVTGLVSAAANGAFYPAWILATLLYVVPLHLSTSLFAVGSAAPHALSHKTRVSLKIAMAVGLPISIVTIAIAQPLLRAFGQAYASEATLPLQILMLGYLPNVVRYHYITVLRVEERLREAAVMLTVLAVLEAVGAGVGAEVGGVNGLAVALVGVMWFEAALTAWPVVRVIDFRLA